MSSREEDLNLRSATKIQKPRPMKMTTKQSNDPKGDLALRKYRSDNQAYR